LVRGSLWAVRAKLEEDGHVRSPPDLRNSRGEAASGQWEAGASTPARAPTRPLQTR